MNGTNEARVEAPVFILGLHRSGTTFLYELLAESGHFNTLAAHHIIGFDQYASGEVDREHCYRRIGRRFDELGLSSRGGEGIRLSPDTLEEYGFILDNQNKGRSLNRRNLLLFNKISAVIQNGQSGRRRLLLKNPWDFANGHQIKRLIRDAKFIFIHRNPFNVLSSSYRAVMDIFSEPHPYLAMLDDRYRRLAGRAMLFSLVGGLLRRGPAVLVKALVRRARRATTGFMASLPLIPLSDRIDVKYEDLCAKPNETVAAILAHLELPPSRGDARSKLVSRSQKVAIPVAMQARFIIKKLSPYATSYGYDLEKLARDL